MLAQGDFTKFLQSKESEKSDILEKLTGTSIYSEIGAEIYAATKERRTEYETRTGSWKASTSWQKKKSPQSRKP